MSGEIGKSPVRVLLIEDDEDDFVLVRDLLKEIVDESYELSWVLSYDKALEMMCFGRNDVCLLDYRLGERDGLDLLQEATAEACNMPIIFLTGQGDYRVDFEAMQAGASDYLVKNEISAVLLERSIRYAIERKRAERVLHESESQLRRLSSKLLTAQEEERKRIARELHDSIGSSLCAMLVSLANALNQMEQDSAPAQAIGILISTVRRTIEDLRRIMTDLRPSILDDFGLIMAIGWLCREMQSIYPQMQMEASIGLYEDEIPEGLKITLFRVLQEALNNIAKHSQAKLVEISLGKKNGVMEMVIKDHGVGFEIDAILDLENGKRGLGLTSMRERMEFSGGSFYIRTSMGEGTTIRASWPRNQGEGSRW